MSGSIMKNIQAIRGMRDILPDTSGRWALVEGVLRDIALQYGYQEIRLPLLEVTELFARTIGEVTDIVEKEMYTFSDRNGDSITLRPEGTAGCIRAGIEHGLFYNKVQRLFYWGPMFRHERPQKGRYRQFHQFGVEAYGFKGPDIDAEMLLLAQRFWQDLNIEHKIQLQINTLGNPATRIEYRDILVRYLKSNYDILDEDSRRRLNSNPLRILDSKNPALQALIKEAPKLFDYLDADARQHFVGLCDILDRLGLPYVVNPTLVRGLDYYSLTVFEWVTCGDTRAQNAVGAGGHYDGLVADMGGKATPAVGFALGLERLLDMLVDNILLPPSTLIYFVLLGDQALAPGMLIAEKIRKKNSKLKVIINCNGGDLKTQLKRADKSGADIAFILGVAELASSELLVKYLRTDEPQKKIKIEEIDNFML